MSSIASAHLIDKERVQELKNMAGTEPEVKKSLLGKVKETKDSHWEWFQKNTAEVATRTAFETSFLCTRGSISFLS